MNPNRTRAILAAQKIRVVSDPKPEAGVKLTPEERKAMYSPKSALEIIPKRPAMPVRVVKSSAKASGVGLAMITSIVAGIMVGETKKGCRS
jgi:hypothetical protein